MMTRTEELLAMCDGSTTLAALLQEDLRQLVELCRLQHEALTFASDFIPTSACKVGECEVCKAISAFNRFEKGGE